MKHFGVVLAVLLVVLSDAQAHDIRLTKLVVERNLPAGPRYPVAFQYDGDAGSVLQVCLLWSGEGPFCWTDFEVDESAKLIQWRAVTRNPNTYRLSGYAVYGDPAVKTNEVSVTIRVR